jgi:hypothetical protein
MLLSWDCIIKKILQTCRPPEPVFVDLLRRLGIDSQPGGPVRNPICRTGAGELDSSESIPGLHKRLQIRAQFILADRIAPQFKWLENTFNASN